MKQHIEFVTRNRSGITAIVTSEAVIDAQTAINHIRSGHVLYDAGPTAWDRARVTIPEAFGRPYLFVNWDGTRRNNLHDLAGQVTDPPLRAPSSTRGSAGMGVLRRSTRVAKAWFRRRTARTRRPW
ncbi:MAG: hypothetical protein JWR01_2957 [Subtercola sp.]|nr:hypothetical protein [Subtercola sp.]